MSALLDAARRDGAGEAVLRKVEQTLRAATETHSHQIGAVGTNL